MNFKQWKLKRTKQCQKCPWRVDTNPFDIPGYSEAQHYALECTIASRSLNLLSEQRPVMTCHETKNAHCIGWLMNQLTVGNNIPLRIQMMSCENRDEIKLVGEQYQTFEETLPKNWV